MTIEISRQERSDILIALRAAQDATKTAYHAARDRAGVHDPDDPNLTRLYALRDKLITLEQEVHELEPV